MRLNHKIILSFLLGTAPHAQWSSHGIIHYSFGLFQRWSNAVIGDIQCSHSFVVEHFISF